MMRQGDSEEGKRRQERISRKVTVHIVFENLIITLRQPQITRRINFQYCFYPPPLITLKLINDLGTKQGGDISCGWVAEK